MRKGPEPIPIPDYFTPVWYDQQKQLRKNDDEIANELHISKPLLTKWKREVECTPYQYKTMAGRKPRVDINIILELRNRGLTYQSIGKMVGLSKESIKYHVLKRSS